MKKLSIALLVALICVGCGKKEDANAGAPAAKPEKAAEAQKDSSKPTTPHAPAITDPDEDVPTTADFEDEAEKEIDKDSVDSEVDSLAKEIGE